MAGVLIIIVDDEDNIVQLASHYLECEGLKVQKASDGKFSIIPDN